MPHRQQSANRLTERVHAAVRAVIARARVHRLLIACSGGTDSTCLLHAVAATSRHDGTQLMVCHIRHGVRADDKFDADSVHDLAARLGIACRIVALDHPAPMDAHMASEGDLRVARYRALAAVARDTSADGILTGHTRDDQAETVLLHLIRGAGVNGLAGMAEDVMLPLPASARSDTTLHSVRVVRPLLSIGREETVRYCMVHGLHVVHDPTNDERRYTRNWIRQEILPALGARNPDIVRTLSRMAATIRDDAAYLAAQTNAAIARCDDRTEDGCISLDYHALVAEHAALQARVLLEMIVSISGSAPRADEIIGLRRHIAESRSTTARSFAGVACCLVFGRAVIGRDQDVMRWVVRVASAAYPLSREYGTVRDGVPVQLGLPDYPMTSYRLRMVPAGSGRPSERDGVTMIAHLRVPEGATITVRQRRPSDFFWPVGSQRPRPLRDYIRWLGVPAMVRDALPLLTINDTIAWVIGHAVSAQFAATEETATHHLSLTRMEQVAGERTVETDG